MILQKRRGQDFRSISLEIFFFFLSRADRLVEIGAPKNYDIMNNGCNLKYVKRDRWKCFSIENRKLVASTMTPDEFSDHSNLFSTFSKERNYTFFAKMRYRKRRDRDFTGLSLPDTER